VLDSKQRKAVVQAAKQIRSLNGYELVHALAGLVGIKRLVDAHAELVRETGPGGLTILNVSDAAAAQLAAGDVLGAAHTLEADNPALEGSLSALLGTVEATQAMQAYRELRSVDCSTSHLLTHGPLDIVGEAYECAQYELGVKIGTGRGEFFTPSSVVQLMVGMTGNPKIGERVNDPCCGSARMLIEAAGSLIRAYGHLEQETGPDHPAGGGRRVLVPPPALFVGQDIAPMGPYMGRIGLVALGYMNHVFKTADSLRDPLTAEEESVIMEARRAALWTAMQRRFPTPTGTSSAAPVPA
jgi:hypothetical protein